VKRLLLGAAVSALLGTSALAQDADVHTITNGTGGQVANYHDNQSGGAAAQSGSVSQSGATANANSRNTNSSTSTSRGGNAASNATGGRGGNASSRTAVSGVGNSSYSQAPSMAMASPGGGGFDCPVVGVGLSGVGPMSGGTGLASWISSDCNRRKLADELARMGHTQAALILLSEDKDVKRALDAEQKLQPVAAIRPDWCTTSSGVELRNHPECR
jgi:hypothetical protein